MICETETKNAAIVYADLERSTLGTRSRVADEIDGQAVLARTVKRLAAVESVHELIVFCPKRQAEAIKGLFGESRAIVCGLENEVPMSKAVRLRKWALRGWRGGLGESTQFDELPITTEMTEMLKQHEVETVLVVAAEAAIADTKLLNELILHHNKYRESMRFTFSQAAPGLAGCVYRLELLHDLAKAGSSVGKLLAYNPASPEADPVNQECTLRVAQELCTSPYRYLADTEREAEAMTAVAAELDRGQGIDQQLKNAFDGEEGCQGSDSHAAIRAMAKVREATERLPHEIDIEINTQPSLRIADYPHGQLTGKREPMSEKMFGKIVDDCKGYDDICLTIGGFGEPLAHPGLIGMIERARSAGIFGINIETDGRLLCGKLAQRLLEVDVDIISVHLDANSAELYEKLKGKACFEQVTENIEAFAAKCKERGKTTVVPHMVKMRETMLEMEDFYDRWINTCQAAVLTGFSDYAGQIADKAVMDMSPPSRWACERLNKRMTILADGAVCVCDQDFAGLCVMGNVTQQSVGEIWLSEKWQRLRRQQRDGRYDGCELCRKCREWHRP